ncbi:tetratricopeptide repeat protein [Cohnella cholangitidis]|uniref:Tetratricopeptide repeat protein n=1 Tax=Cohnella cholangitidis TaxID=2598458 RepID=A0A7G5BWQ3_9BACL|nr:hypothetical protein [Cohnella cholangitidis]QMV41387.1 hypothetical protein FPL14_09420 [Cohnella cholangitidis]
MKYWKRWTLSFTLAIFALLSVQIAPGTANSEESFEPIMLSELKGGQELFEPISKFIKDSLELSEEDASAITTGTVYEVDLGNYPKGYTRQFLSFVYNYEWIELVLVTANEDASSIKLLNRAVSSDAGDMFLNTAKLEFSTAGNHVYIWTQSPYSAYESYVDLEWAGDTFYVAEHEFDDPTKLYFEEKAQLVKAKDIEGLIAQYDSMFPLYPSFYESNFTLAAPALKLAHQKALQVQKKDVKKAIKYLEYGLDQYGDAFGIWGYTVGTLKKTDIVGNPDDSNYRESRLTLSAYVGILNDYGYFLSLAGRNKEAQPILANVIKLVPSRTVAYLNIADVEWTLGQKTAAKAHYKQYWKLLGSKASTIAPKRVKDRMK